MLNSFVLNIKTTLKHIITGVVTLLATQNLLFLCIK